MPTTAMAMRAGFLGSVERFAERPALEVAGRTWSYAALARLATSLARTLVRHAPANDPPLTAVFASRSATAFAGVLASLLRGHGFVPLNPSFPADRTRAMLGRSGARAVVVDRAAMARLDEVLLGSALPLVLVLPEHDDVRDIAARLPCHVVLGARDLADAEGWTLPDAGPLAYLLFTSGSTGTPKGVAVPQSAVVAFVDHAVARYGIGPDDRFSQTFDLTFDLAVFDMFVAWQRGACVVCPSLAEKMLPATFLETKRLTVWFSVPSTGLLLERFGTLRADRLPTLRWSLFCGEALPARLAAAWQRAAPNSIVENLYGPTELTIACTQYRWDAERSPAQCRDGVVPIGEPFAGMQVLVVDEALAEVPPGGAGELLMTGPQLSRGYWQDPELTRRAFVTPPGRTAVFYRTGDRVRRPAPGEPLVWLGRKDFQVKIAGYRVELGEIEAAVRDEMGIDGAVALGWPRTESGATGVVVFVVGGVSEVDTEALRARLAQRLPAYMVPAQIVVVADWPLDANGKVDRHVLVRRLEAGTDAHVRTASQ